MGKIDGRYTSTQRRCEMPDFGRNLVGRPDGVTYFLFENGSVTFPQAEYVLFDIVFVASNLLSNLCIRAVTSIPGYELTKSVKEIFAAFFTVIVPDPIEHSS